MSIGADTAHKVQMYDEFGHFYLINPPARRSKPLVSVLIAVYNGELTIEAAIISVADFNSVFCEIIVIDDGSTDSTLDRILALSKKDSRILIVQQQNIGLTKSLCRGLKLAKGKFVARLDADDLSVPNRLDEQISILEDSEYFLTGTLHCGMIHADSGADCQILDDRHLFRGNPLVHSSIVFYRDPSISYDPTYTYSQDYEFYFRVLEKGPIFATRKAFTIQGESDFQISKSQLTKQRYFALKARIMHFSAFPCVESIIYIVRAFVIFMILAIYEIFRSGTGLAQQLQKND